MYLHIFLCFYSNYNDRSMGGPPSRGYGGPPRAVNGGNGSFERSSPWAPMNGGNNLMSQHSPPSILPSQGNSGMSGGHSGGPGSGGSGGPGKSSTQVTIPKDVRKFFSIFFKNIIVPSEVKAFVYCESADILACWGNNW